MSNLSAHSNPSHREMLAFATKTTATTPTPEPSLDDDLSPDHNARESTGTYSRLLVVDDDDVDLILLDYQLGDMTGAELLNELQKHNKPPIPTIMITGMGDEGTAIEAMRLGVFDYLPKQSLTAESLMSIVSSALQSVNLKKHLQKTQDTLRRMSLYDSLTGLPNRNLFFDRLNHAILSGNRNKGAFSILMIDLNLFKEVNDNLGHKAGDKVRDWCLHWHRALPESRSGSNRLTFQCGLRNVSRQARTSKL